jgi:hypothetical protein
MSLIGAQRRYIERVASTRGKVGRRLKQVIRARWVAKGAAFLVLVLTIVAIVSFVVMSLWNALIPNLFHGPVLQYWQALGLLILCRLLFGGFRGRGHGWHSHGGGGWRRHWRHHWENMTPEERERLRAKMKERCGWYPDEPPAEQPDSNRPT